MATDPTDPLPDIEAAIKEEVAGMNRAKRPPVQFSSPTRFSSEAGSGGLPRPENAVAGALADAVAQAQPEPTTLPEILDLLIQQIMTLDDRLSVRLTRIERVLGIKG